MAMATSKPSVEASGEELDFVSQGGPEESRLCCFGALSFQSLQKF